MPKVLSIDKCLEETKLFHVLFCFFMKILFKKKNRVEEEKISITSDIHHCVDYVCIEATWKVLTRKCLVFVGPGENSRSLLGTWFFQEPSAWLLHEYSVFARGIKIRSNFWYGSSCLIRMTNLTWLPFVKNVSYAPNLAVVEPWCYFPFVLWWVWCVLSLSLMLSEIKKKVRNGNGPSPPTLVYLLPLAFHPWWILLLSNLLPLDFSLLLPILHN